MLILWKVRSCGTVRVLRNGYEFIGGSKHVGLNVVGRGLNECHFVNRVLDFNLLPETINLLETRGI